MGEDLLGDREAHDRRPLVLAAVAVTTVQHAHHWLIASQSTPRGYPATCKDCGESKHFPSDAGNYRWEEEQSAIFGRQHAKRKANQPMSLPEDRYSGGGWVDD